MFKSAHGITQLTQNGSDPSFLESRQANLLMCSSPAVTHKFISSSDTHGMARGGMADACAVSVSASAGKMQYSTRAFRESLTAHRLIST